MKNDNIKKEIEEERLKTTKERAEKLRGKFKFTSLTVFHAYLEALIGMYSESRDKLRRSRYGKTDAELIIIEKELKELKKYIKDAQNCQEFLETLYKEELEMRGYEVISTGRYLWCDEKEWEELVESWRNYLYIRSYGTDRRDY